MTGKSATTTLPLLAPSLSTSTPTSEPPSPPPPPPSPPRRRATRALILQYRSAFLTSQHIVTMRLEEKGLNEGCSLVHKAGVREADKAHTEIADKSAEWTRVSALCCGPIVTILTASSAVIVLMAAWSFACHDPTMDPGTCRQGHGGGSENWMDFDVHWCACLDLTPNAILSSKQGPGLIFDA